MRPGTKTYKTKWNPDGQPSIYPMQPFLDANPALRDSLGDFSSTESLVVALAEKLGCSERHLDGWLRSDYVNEHIADSLACATRTHIGVIWPDIYWPADEIPLAV